MVNWKNKLLALLHDPPSKAFNIPDHESLALTLLRQAGFSEEEAERFSRQADWDASAADRMPFPASQAAGIRCRFDGVPVFLRPDHLGRDTGLNPIAVQVSFPPTPRPLGRALGQRLEPSPVG